MPIIEKPDWYDPFDIERDKPKDTLEEAIQILEGLEGLARREAVNHPEHYNKGKIEVIDAIEDWGLDFNAGNVVKYIARYRYKSDQIEDLKKARWYLDRLIEGLENVGNENQ